MELDDLKGVWKQQAKETEDLLLTDDELLAMVRSKATSSIHSLKRSVRFELGFTVLFILACVTYGFASADRTIGNVSFILAVLSCGFGVFYYRKLSLLNALTVENMPLRENLAILVTKFETFLRIYRWGYNILIPISLAVGAILGIWVSSEKDFVQLVLQKRLWALLIVILVPMTVMVNWTIKWYLKKLYGNHLSRLHALLQELQD